MRLFVLIVGTLDHCRQQWKSMIQETQFDDDDDDNDEDGKDEDIPGNSEPHDLSLRNASSNSPSR